jgi:murein DD-endopeptidase MepM/ murein hydrolase activator NlpD
MSNARIPYLMGGVLVAGFAALSILSYNALRTDVNRTSEIVFWSVIKDSTDKNVLSAYLTRYPDGMFVPAVKARMEELDKGGGTALAAAGGTIAAQIAALQAQQQAADQAAQKAAEEARAKAQAEADRILADAKAEAAKQAEFAKAEAAKQAESAKAEAAKQVEMAKAEAARAAEQAKAEQAKIEQARAEAAKQAEIAKAEAAKAAEQAKLAAAKPAPVPVPVQQAQRPAPAPTQTAAAPAPMPTPAPGASSFVIISSTADGMKKGDRVGMGQAIAVPSGTRVVLMDASGKVMTVRGPFSGTLGTSEPTAPTPRATGAFRSVSDASGLLERLGDALREQSDAPRRIGAFRGVGAAGLGLGAAPADPWTIDVSAAGHWCVAADRAVTLTRGKAAGFESITIESKPSGAKMDVPWPKSQATLQWPASVPVKNGATYELRMGATTTSIAVHMLDQKGLTSGQVALWMAEQGCQRQASAMIDSLERGLVGKLFDLEVGGDGRASASYKVGEELKLSIRSSRDAYVYCFYRDVAGEVTKIFPSQFDRTAQIGAGGAQSIPAPAWEAPMQLTGPAGASEVQCFALDRDATKDLPAEIGKPGFAVLPAKMASSLMDVFKRVPDGNVATASMPITVTE